MSRFMILQRIKEVGHSISTCHKGSYSTDNHWLFSTYGLPSSCTYSSHKIYGRQIKSFLLYEAETNLCKITTLRRFSAFSGKSSIRHHAQVAWKKLYTSSLSKFFCITSLAVSRSQLVPSTLAILAGELAFAQTVWADGKYFPAQNALYMQAQNGQVYFTLFILSVLEFFVLVARAIYLALLFLPMIVLAPFAESCCVQHRKMWLHLVHSTLEKAGPAFIKWGQWVATRPDLFPSDLCNELKRLHNKAPSHSFAYTKRTIEKAFGRKLSEIFENFEEEPVASGSVAQVHRASLRFCHFGQPLKHEDVAVKVRHPGVGEWIKRDFVLINLVAKISKLIPTLNWLRLDESVQQFAVFMMSQVDLAREAAHLSRFIYNFRKWKDVSFPKPLYPLVHPAVLVETYENGESVSYYVDELEGHDGLKRALVDIGSHALLKMLLVDNFIHADLHPGNILVRTQTNQMNKGLFKSKPHIVFLDVGMTAELSKTDRVNLLDFFKAVAIRDGRKAAECTLRLSKQQYCPNPKAFIEEVEKSFSFWGSHEGRYLHPSECMHQLLEQVQRHKVSIDSNVCTVMVTTLVLEGWQRKLDPEYNVMHTLRSMLFRSDWAQSLLYIIQGLMAL